MASKELIIRFSALVLAGDIRSRVLQFVADARRADRRLSYSDRDDDPTIIVTLDNLAAAEAFRTRLIDDTFGDLVQVEIRDVPSTLRPQPAQRSRTS